MLNAFDIDPGTLHATRSWTMLNFNHVVLEQPNLSPILIHIVVSKKRRCSRMRVGNLTMTNHPIHMHGYDFKISCTDGGWVDPAIAMPEVSIDVAVGQMRAFDFKADHLGDWAIHCHKSHHTMNAMGHDIPTFIGADKSKAD